MCEHYNRNCKIIAPCCNKIFDCRFCHDNFFEDDHKINRYNIKKIICNKMYYRIYMSKTYGAS